MVAVRLKAFTPNSAIAPLRLVCFVVSVNVNSSFSLLAYLAEVNRSERNRSVSLGTNCVQLAYLPLSLAF